MEEEEERRKMEESLVVFDFSRKQLLIILFPGPKLCLKISLEALTPLCKFLASLKSSACRLSTLYLIGRVCHAPGVSLGGMNLQIAILWIEIWEM